MPQKLMQCYNSVKADLQRQHGNWSDQRVDRVARAICVSKTGQTFTKHESVGESIFDVKFSESGKVEKLSFKFQAPITQVTREEFNKIVEKDRTTRPRKKDILPNDPNAIPITGTAAYQGTSKNFHYYSEAELVKAVNTLVGKPCQKDHSVSMRDTFGTVIDAWHDDTSTRKGELAFAALLDGADPDSQRVAKNYVRGVSVAGHAEKLICRLCGEEWSWSHEHFIGMTYEGKVCDVDMIGISFDHLGFTSFPAMEDADANYVPVTMDEAIDNALVYMEAMRRPISGENLQENCGCDKPKESISNNQVIRFGENTMSANDKDLLKDVEKLRYQLEEKEREKNTLTENIKKQQEEATAMKTELERSKEREKTRLVKEVANAEISLGKVEQTKFQARTDELSKLTIDVLEAKLEVLNEFLREKKVQETARPSVPKSKQFGAGSNFAELSEDRRKFYEQEAKKANLAQQLFDEQPSVGSVQALSEWDHDMKRWKTGFSELVKRTPKKGAHTHPTS